MLKLDVYRVDLAAVVNKYVGETEKNLSRLISRAEDLNVLLLLDEGDSLMTGRTDVKSATATPISRPTAALPTQPPPTRCV